MPTPAAPRPLAHIVLAPGPELVFELSEPPGEAIHPCLSGLAEAFEHGPGPGLLRLAHPLDGFVLSPNLFWWRRFALMQISRLCRGAGSDLDAQALGALLLEAPLSCGVADYHANALGVLGSRMARSLDEAARLGGLSRQDILAQTDPAWARVGRAHFELSECDADPEAPFLFRAMYCHEIDSSGLPFSTPLGLSIKSFALAQRQSELDGAVLPLYAAAKKSSWAQEALRDPAAGPLLKPSRWTPAQTWSFLLDASKMEAAGISILLPPSWGGKLPALPEARAYVGQGAPAMAGARALLDFKMEVALGGAVLTPDEIETLGRSEPGLARLRGQWVRVDADGLGAAIRHFRQIEQRAALEGLTFAEAMRLSASSRAQSARHDSDGAKGPDWQVVQAGAWLADALARLRSPGSLELADPGALLSGTLRPYQAEGVRWLHLLHSLGLGACLADDMGLGKTIQILALLLILKRDLGSRPSLLVAPASLLENWANEAERFAPGLSVAILHGSTVKNSSTGDIDPAKIHPLDLVVTSYGTLMRSKTLRDFSWRLAIADEAQAIKNPGTQTAKSCKALHAQSRVALTGTPVENRLGDLWSILDYTHPGLLGTRSEFNAFHSKLVESKNLEPLRSLVKPYVLRRKKTDKSVISDLPDKIETIEICHLSPRQAALYQGAVDDMRRDLASASGFGRHGIVISYLTRLKQICNHPAHWLRDGPWKTADSGKVQMLRELAQEISDSDGRVLVFTQYQEAVAPLSEHLASIFGASGLALHGGVRVGKPRQGLVDAFQAEDGPPFMVLTVKAGGTGLNLTAASHVIHFDRWWNPAVENQATDRAYRIGQTRNVSVHKLVCKGTIEERIDEMIASKIQLADDAISEHSGAHPLSSLSDKDLLDLVRLDLHSSEL